MIYLLNISVYLRLFIACTIAGWIGRTVDRQSQVWSLCFRYCSKPVYNVYACALRYGLFRFIHNACSCRRGSCDSEGNCLVELIIPAYSVGFSVANLYTRPAHATLQVARCNFQLENICQQSSLNLALHLIRH